MLSGDIRVKVEEDFGVPDAGSIEAELARFAEAFREHQGSPPSDRLLRCIVHLAEGEKDVLSNQIQAALVDWRDVIHSAEYSERGERVYDFTLPFPGPELTQAQTQAAGGGERSSPESIITAFIRAMNEWELRAWDASRKARTTSDPESYWPEVAATLDRVFAEFCTTRERPQGREASFQRPPEYDPESERVVGHEIAGNRAYVDTEREAPLGGGRLRYTLHQRGGKWLIDNVKQKSGDGWTKSIL